MSTSGLGADIVVDRDDRGLLDGRGRAAQFVEVEVLYATSPNEPVGSVLVTVGAGNACATRLKSAHCDVGVTQR